MALAAAHAAHAAQAAQAARTACTALADLIMDVHRRNAVKVLGSQGPLLLSAPGFGGSQAMWAGVAAAFAGTHRCTRFDDTSSSQPVIDAPGAALAAPAAAL